MEPRKARLFSLMTSTPDRAGFVASPSGASGECGVADMTDPSRKAGSQPDRNHYYLYQLTYTLAEDPGKSRGFVPWWAREGGRIAKRIKYGGKRRSPRG